MANLIDRDALPIIGFAASEDVSEDFKAGVIYAGNAYRDAIKCATAVEAEPVQHGRWIHCKGKSNLWHCSNCGETITYNPKPRTYQITKPAVHEKNKRCRNCGAKMGTEERI